MEPLRRLIREIHQRSLWQVLGIFVAASWAVLQVVELLTETAGLPDWTPSMALVLLLIGLPICLATAIVQEGMPGQESARPAPPRPQDGPNLAAGTGSLDRPSTRPSRTRRLLTWKHALLGGVAAMALLGVTVVAYIAMWSTGIGPVGSLQAQGLIDEGDPVLLADFTNRTSDESLGPVVTEALRVDLASTRVVTLVEPLAVGEVLGMMGRETGEPVRGAVADEIAARGGYRAIIEGEIGSAGAGYILLASIRSASGGRTLATFRRTAADESEVIAAIDGLSQDIRERAGESLRSIRADEPLEAVTTSSLEALRLFTEAEEVRETGDDARARTLIEEALRLDPQFAMAWRMLSVLYRQTGGTREQARDAATRAYELRHRLTERERYGTVALYHREVTGDLMAEIAAYETLLDAYPDDATGLNNLSIAYSDLTRWDDASALLERAINGPARSFSNYANRVLYTALGGDFEAAHRALDELESLYPDAPLWPSWTGFVLAWAEGDAEEARRRAVDLQGVPDAPNWRRAGTASLAISYLLTGEHGAFREVMRGALEEARRANDPIDEVGMQIRWASAEALIGSGEPVPLLRAVFDSDVLDRSDPALRDNFPWVEILAWSGMRDEARRLLREWSDASGEESNSPIEVLRSLVDVAELGERDPSAAAAELARLRSSVGCVRCWTWELGELYERAGRVDDAIREREHTLEGAQDFDFGFHRIAAHEALGRLYEQRGDTAQAIEHYQAYVEQLVNGDGLPRVERARERLAVLR
jgi:tetratricopeptide (TPR) repeat protein